MELEITKHFKIDFDSCELKFNEEGIEIIKKQLRKVTGSRFWAISHLYDDPDTFNTQFSAFLRLIGFKIPMLTSFYVNAGTFYEKLIFISLKELLEDRYGKDVKVEHITVDDPSHDYFPDVELFGGEPDVLVSLPNGEKIVYDIKTKGISSARYGLDSDSYRYQTELYRHLLKYDSSKLAYIFLEDEDYDYEETPKNISKIDIEEVDLEPINVEMEMDKVRKNIDRFFETGISPKFDIEKHALELSIISKRPATREEYIETIKKYSIDIKNRKSF